VFGVINSNNHRRIKLVDKNQEKKNGELLAGKKNEMMTTKECHFMMFAKNEKKPKIKRTPLGCLYSKRMEKIMKITLVFHVNEAHENKRTFTRIEP